MNPLKDYYNGISDMLAAQSQVAGMTRHSSDTGSNREQLICDFLNKHLPGRLTATLGGVVIGYKQPQSKQVDVLVKNDLSPRFEENQKTFLVAESVMAAVSIKSYLDKNSLWDSLENIASIPQFSPEILTFKALKTAAFEEFQRFYPRLFIFAYEGISCASSIKHLTEFYQNNLASHNRLPINIIVNGKYTVRFSQDGAQTFDKTQIEANTFYPQNLPEDFRGYPLVDMINLISNCLGWLPYMELNAFNYFNSGYWE